MAAAQDGDRASYAMLLREIAPVLRGTHIVAHPSLNDGRSVAVLEAMAWGRPVVASRVGGLPELVEDGVSGRLVTAGEAGELAEALRSLIGDREAREAMGRAARRNPFAPPSPGGGAGRWPGEAHGGTWPAARCGSGAGRR